jgi:PAS domain-containing protein
MQNKRSTGGSRDDGRHLVKLGRICAEHTVVSAANRRKGCSVTDDAPDVLAEATDLTRAEEIRLRYAAIVESSDDAIIAKTLEGVISAWNAAAERMFGYREHEALGQPITMIIPPVLHEEEYEILRRLRAWKTPTGRKPNLL